ncbi:flagellar motor protein MotB [Allohahella sp. A8]|uniref:flagellar motor protein MotB n=1 Tax=Allohahella sp. A8 TaxID=3141461 RepID=UPI000C0A1D80|nr:type VI secretion system protein TssL [Hahellaceae bacterium]|tara:strand:+ start:44268 stop:45248 length:981 start_codon:yes stop_codon:yes gene_type:complete
MVEEEKKHECPAGIPAWMATFADLMSLLMCFFVLLLSFAQMDALEFKRLAGSMKDAFGVQNQVDVTSIPKGTSVIAQEFSPGKPEPTPLQMIMQQTTSSDMPNLEQVCEQIVEKALADQCPIPPAAELSDEVVEQLEAMAEEAESTAVQLATALEPQVRNNQIEVETRGRQIIIRVQERGAFASGSASLNADFFPVIDNMVEVLKQYQGNISVEGHTDNIPIKTARFRSNWDLSTARALEVAHALFESGDVGQERFAVTGAADTTPLVPNDTPEGRARNRRVEIVVEQPLDPELAAELERIRDSASPALDVRKQLQIRGLSDDEIF